MFLQTATLVAVLTIISKVLGLIRDLMIAHYFGTSVYSDAFNIAYLLTGNFFVVFGCINGPFYNAIVAVFPKLNSEYPLKKLFKKILLQISLGLLLLSFVLYLIKNWFLGFFVDPADQVYFKLTSINIDILLPMVLLCGPVGILAGILNCYKRYIEPSFSPALINIALIFSLLIMGDSSNGLALAIGTSIGALLSVLYQVPALRSIFPKVEPASHACSKEFYLILFPALLTTGAAQLIGFVDGFFCKGLEPGSFSALTLANRLVQMPMGVVMTALFVPFFPQISQLASQQNIIEIKRKLKKLYLVLLATSIPALIVGMVWTKELIAIIFQRGAFDAHSTQLVASVFFYLSIYSLPYVFKEALIRVSYAFGESRLPLLVMIWTLFFKIVLNYLLVPHFAVAGIAIATLITTVFNFVFLYFVLEKKYLR